jgi:DNA-directed RNA polymerase subunit RPC12/RpoP
MKKQYECMSCGKSPLVRDEVGVNKKLLGAEITQFQCIDCLAEFLEITVDELMGKIEEFKAEGCKLFS